MGADLRNFTVLLPTNKSILDLPGGGNYNLSNPSNIVDSNASTFGSIVLEGSYNLPANSGIYLPVALQLNIAPTWFYSVNVNWQSVTLPSGVNVYLFFQIVRSLDLTSPGNVIVNQVVIKKNSDNTYSPQTFNARYVSSSATFSDNTLSLFSGLVSPGGFTSFTTASKDTNVKSTGFSGTPSLVDLNTAFSGLLFPRISELRTTNLLYVVLQFLVYNTNTSSVTLPSGALINIYDFKMVIPDTSGEVYKWIEGVGLSGPTVGSSSVLFDGSTTTGGEDIILPPPRNGILVIYPNQKQVSTLRVYISQVNIYSTSTPRLKLYTGVDTLPPTVTPRATANLSNIGWYSLITAQTLLDWAYFIEISTT